MDICREWSDRLAAVQLPTHSSHADLECRIDLVVRQAVAGAAEGYGITAYLSATGRDRAAAAEALTTALAAFADSVSPVAAPETAASKLQ